MASTANNKRKADVAWADEVQHQNETIRKKKQPHGSNSCAHLQQPESFASSDFIECTNLDIEFLGRVRSLRPCDRGIIPVLDIANEIYLKYSHWGEKKKEIFRQIIVSHGTEVILKKANQSDLMKECTFWSAVPCVVLLTTIDKRDDPDVENSLEKTLQKLGNVVACPRKIVHFFNLRNSCNCLEGLYTKVKEIAPLTAICFQRERFKSKKRIKVCSQCGFAQYCSKQCQIADWKNHKQVCRPLRKQIEEEKTGEQSGTK
jgi:hypothetical protein